MSAFEEQARTLGVSNRVRFHGFESTPPRAYHAADVFVYPSDYDAFGLVVAEAMAAALPVIAGDRIGAAEWITHQQNGLLCQAHDAASLRRQLDWLRADPIRARELGRAARAAAAQHTWDACADATAAVYEQVLTTRAKG